MLRTKKQIIAKENKAVGGMAEINKILEESLCRAPFLLPYLYVAISNTEELVSKNELKNLFDKYATYLTVYEFGHLKFKL